MMTWHSQALTIRRRFQVLSKCPSKMSNTGCEADGFATETKCSHQSMNMSYLIQPEGTWRLCLRSSSGEMIGIPSVQKLIRDETKLPVAFVYTGRPPTLDPLRTKALWYVYWMRKIWKIISSHLSGIEPHTYYILYRTRKYILKMVLKSRHRSNLRIYIFLNWTNLRTIQCTKYSNSWVISIAVDDDSWCLRDQIKFISASVRFWTITELWSLRT